MSEVTKQIHPTLSKVPFLGKALPGLQKYVEPAAAKLQNTLTSLRGPNYNHGVFIGQPTVNIPKENMVYNSIKTPRSLIFEHEVGHAIHKYEDPKALHPWHQPSDAVGKLDATLTSERIANNNALLNMQKNNVSPQVMQDYLEHMNKAYGTYKDTAKMQGAGAQLFDQYKKELPNAAWQSIKNKLGLTSKAESEGLQALTNKYIGRGDNHFVEEFAKNHPELFSHGPSSLDLEHLGLKQPTTTL
jgi:hypothetical protein